MSFSENDEERSAVACHSRKRPRNESQWKAQLVKERRNKGVEYISRYTKKVIAARKTGEPCKCGCFNQIGMEKIKIIFERFWDIGNYDMQNVYIAKRVTSKEVKRSRVKGRPCRTNRRLSYTIIYENEGWNVCSKAFYSIHGVSEKRVRTAIRKQSVSDTPESDKRGKTPTVFRVSDERKAIVHHHISSLTTTVSRLNIRAMYKLYLGWIEHIYPDSLPVSEHCYRAEFKQKFNVGFERKIKQEIISDDDGNHQKKPGHSQAVATKVIMTREQESALVDYLNEASTLFYGLSSASCRELAYQYVESNNLQYPRSWKLHECADSEWMRQFRTRNKNFMLRPPEFSYQNIGMFYEKLAKILEMHKFSHHDVYCIDDIGCSTRTEAVVTAVGIITASGNSLPLCFVFPKEGMTDEDQLMVDSPIGSKVFSNPTGRMTSKIFIKVLEHIKEHSNCNTEHPILLIMDNQHSHISLSAINYANGSGIILLPIPPQASDKLQPMKNSVYGPFKDYYSSALNDWKTQHPKRKPKYYELTAIIIQCWEKAATSETMKAGFHTTGIFPFNRSIFSESDFVTTFINKPELDPLVDVEVDAFHDEDDPPTDAEEDVSENEDDPLAYVEEDVSIHEDDPLANVEEDTSDNEGDPQLYDPLAVVKEDVSDNENDPQPSTSSKPDTLDRFDTESTNITQQTCFIEAAKPLKKAVKSHKKPQQSVIDSNTGSDEISPGKVTNLREDDLEDMNSLSEDDLKFQEEHEETPVHFAVAREPIPGDYVLVTVESKDSRDNSLYHIAKILKEAPKKGDFTVLFLQLNQATPGPSLFYPKPEDKAEVKREQIISILLNAQPARRTHKSQAVQYHEDLALLGSNADNVAQSNNQEIQSGNSVEHLNNLWQEKILSEGLNKVDMMEAVHTYAKKHPEITIKIHSSVNFSIAVVTDFMKKCHKEIEEVQHVCYLETAVHHNLVNTAVTILMGASSGGAVPLGIVFSSDQDTDSYVTGFQLLKEALGPTAFYGKLQPEAFMIKDCSVTRQALECVWPGSVPLLCSSSLLSTTRRKFFEPKCSFPEHDQSQMISVMKHLINADSSKQFDSTYKNFLEGPFSHHKQFINFLRRYVARKYEWSHAYQSPCTNDRQNAENCCEPTLYIFNHIVTSRCKIYNAASLVMYMSEIFSGYLQQRFQDRVLGEKQKLLSQSIIDEFDFTHNGDQSFTMKSKRSEDSYDIDLKVGICSCHNYFATPCEHQVACAEVTTMSLPKALSECTEMRRRLTAVAIRTQEVKDVVQSSSTSQIQSQQPESAKHEEVMVKVEPLEEVTIKHEAIVVEDVFEPDLPSTSDSGPQGLYPEKNQLQTPRNSQSHTTQRLYDPQIPPESSRRSLPLEDINMQDQGLTEYNSDKMTDKCDGANAQKDLNSEFTSTSDLVTEGSAPKRRRLGSYEGMQSLGHRSQQSEGAFLRQFISQTPQESIPILQSLREEVLNQYEIFGIHVAKELSDVSDEYSFKQAKIRINDIIFKAKLGHYKTSIQKESSIP